MLVPGVGALPRFIDAAQLGEQTSQSPGGVPIDGVGADPQLIDAVLRGEQTS
jgi:hypothetical protein